MNFGKAGLPSYHPDTGKQRVITVSGKTQKEVLEKLQRRMLDAGEDLKSLQENLGHATAAFTLTQYAHVSQKMRLQSSKRMNDYFQKLMPEAETAE